MPPRPRAVVDPAAGSETFAAWARRVFTLSRTEEELVGLAQAALDLAHDDGEPGSVRLAAAGRFQAVLKDLKLPTEDNAWQHLKNPHPVRTTSHRVI